MSKNRAGHRIVAAKRPRLMRPLSEVFAPGAPTLPERLRTLVVSPERELEPGMSVRAVFNFRNHGGAPATGVRLRFNVPEGLAYLVGSSRLDGNELDDELGNSPLLARAGAAIGDVAPGEERRIEIAYSVTGAIENGTTIELQAALASFELPPAGSNVVRLVVRSKPQLENALTRITIEPRHDPVPGAEAQVTINIHNAGESSARDVVIVAPIPENASYVPGSARVSGREIERDLGTAFDRCYAPILLRSLPASASATLVYHVRIDSPLTDGSQITARAEIASQETPAFALEPGSLTVTAAPGFGDDRTSLTIEPEHDAHPGERVTLTVTAYNAGTAPADRVSVNLELPDSLVFVRGATTIDGYPVHERRKEPLQFELGPIGAGEQIVLRAHAIVSSPLADGTVLTPTALVEWEPAPPQRGTARLQSSITVRSEPVFTPRRSFFERRGSETVRPGERLEAAIVLANDGGAAAHDALLHVRADPALEEIELFETGTRLNLEGSAPGAPRGHAVDLGIIEPHTTRHLTLRARVPSPCADRTDLPIGASLHTRELAETPLRDIVWRVDSHPAFSEAGSRLELADDSVLRPNQVANVDVILVNAGTDCAHNVRLRLYISPEARLEHVEGATREKSSLLFGEIPAGRQARAQLQLRLLRSLAKEYPIAVDAVLTADAMLPVPLAQVTIATAADPDFSAANFYSTPAESVDVGETVEWTLQVRNGGDGGAHDVRIAVTPLESLIYVPNSTTVNDVPIRDVGALAPFASSDGITLNEVDPGVEATIRWRTVVHNALAAGTSIAYVGHVRYDGERDDEIVSPELHVRAEPVFANAIPGLPFGLDGMLGPAPPGRPRAPAEDRFVQLPPASPVGDGNGAPRYAQLPAGDEPAFYEGAIRADGAGTMVAFTAERLGRTLRFLREARFGGLVTHLFALRAFLPEAIGDGYCGALPVARDLLREELDRLFIKLRLPSYAIAPRDIETPSLRSTIERLLQEIEAAHGVPAESPAAAIVLHGRFESSEMRDLAERLEPAALATALPWAALARLLPDEAPEYAHYRTRLIERLDALEDSESGDFIEALQHANVAALDAALDVMCATLHAIA
jgi:uncharacterized repeat protein (TIGR01451 family)